MEEKEKISSEVQRISDYVIMIINYETPKMFLTEKYSHQNMLEEVIKELQKRV